MNLLISLKNMAKRNSKLYFEEYADMVDDIGIGVVSAFLNVFDIENVSSCRDAYMGRYDSGAEFAQSIAEDCGEVGSNSSWIEIDWKASWDKSKL